MNEHTGLAEVRRLPARPALSLPAAPGVTAELASRWAEMLRLRGEEKAYRHARLTVRQAAAAEGWTKLFADLHDGEKTALLLYALDQSAPRLGMCAVCHTEPTTGAECRGCALDGLAAEVAQERAEEYDHCQPEEPAW